MHWGSARMQAGKKCLGFQPPIRLVVPLLLVTAPNHDPVGSRLAELQFVPPKIARQIMVLQEPIAHVKLRPQKRIYGLAISTRCLKECPRVYVPPLRVVVIRDRKSTR